MVNAGAHRRLVRSFATPSPRRSSQLVRSRLLLIQAQPTATIAIILTNLVKLMPPFPLAGIIFLFG